MKYICWDEPGDDGKTVRVRITREEALKRMAHVRAKHPNAYDAVLIADFTTHHGAWEEWEEEEAVNKEEDLEYTVAGLCDGLIKIKDLALEGLCTDGAHHKQYVLAEILRNLDPAKYQELREAGEDLGVAP